jgi:hypothetical protein
LNKGNTNQVSITHRTIKFCPLNKVTDEQNETKVAANLVESINRNDLIEKKSLELENKNLHSYSKELNDKIELYSIRNNEKSEKIHRLECKIIQLECLLNDKRAKANDDEYIYSLSQEALIPVRTVPTIPTETPIPTKRKCEESRDENRKKKEKKKKNLN